MTPTRVSRTTLISEDVSSPECVQQVEVETKSTNVPSSRKGKGKGKLKGK